MFDRADLELCASLLFYGLALLFGALVLGLGVRLLLWAAGL